MRARPNRVAVGTVGTTGTDIDVRRAVGVGSGLAHRVAAAAYGAGGDAASPFASGGLDGLSEARNRVGKSRRVWGKAEQIVKDQDLTMGLEAGTNADEREGGAGHDFGGDLFRDGLDEEHRGAGSLQRDGVCDNSRGVFTRAACGAIAACECGALGKAAHVRTNGDARASHRCDGVGECRVAFELDNVGEAFGHKATGIAHCVGDADLVTKEGKIAHHDRSWRAALDRGGKGEGNLHRHVDGPREAKDDLGGGIAHQEHVDARSLEQAGEGRVVTREACKGGALARHSTEGAERDGPGNAREGTGARGAGSRIGCERLARRGRYLSVATRCHESSVPACSVMRFTFTARVQARAPVASGNATTPDARTDGCPGCTPG